MSYLRDMQSRWSQPGTVTWIGVRPSRRAEMLPLTNVQVAEAGLQGDRARAGKRAVTLIQAEHLPAIAAYLGVGAVSPHLLRRNFVVAGVNLAALKGRDLKIGTAVLRLSVICAPCSRMEETFGHGGYSAVRGHGGWCAEVIAPGAVQLGDAVCPLDVGTVG